VSALRLDFLTLCVCKYINGVSVTYRERNICVDILKVKFLTNITTEVVT